MFFSAVFLITIFKFTIGNSCEILGTCDTPDNQGGYCITLEECPRLYAIYQKLNLNKTEIDFLKSSQCGYVDEFPLVCCPISESCTELTLLPLPGSGFCGVQLKDYIKEGESLAAFGEYPWAANLVHEESNTFVCTGTVINNRHVLTAAHCIDNEFYGKVVAVRLGDWDLENDPDCLNSGNQRVCVQHIDIPVETIKIHEEYSVSQNFPSIGNDIALIRLDSPIEFNLFVQPICLPLADRLKILDQSGKILEATGWGAAPNSIKKKITFKRLDSQRCKEKLTFLGLDFIANVIGEPTICVENDTNENSCYGDTGGPLMAIEQDINNQPYHYLVGIHSFGLECDMKFLPAIHTSVGHHIEWIVENVKV